MGCMRNCIFLVSLVSNKVQIRSILNQQTLMKERNSRETTVKPPHLIWKALYIQRADTLQVYRYVYGEMGNHHHRLDCFSFSSLSTTGLNSDNTSKYFIGLFKWCNNNLSVNYKRSYSRIKAQFNISLCLFFL